MRAEPHLTGPLFSVHAEAFGQVMRVWFMGELNEVTAPECLLDLRDPLAGREPIVVLDLGGVSMVDRSGIEALFVIKRDLEARGRRLLLSSVSNGTTGRLPPEVAASFDVLDGGLRSTTSCGLCDRPLPSDLHLCPHCGAIQ